MEVTGTAAGGPCCAGIMHAPNARNAVKQADAQHHLGRVRLLQPPRNRRGVPNHHCGVRAAHVEESGAVQVQISASLGASRSLLDQRHTLLWAWSGGLPVASLHDQCAVALSVAHTRARLSSSCLRLSKGPKWGTQKLITLSS